MVIFLYLIELTLLHMRRGGLAYCRRCMLLVAWVGPAAAVEHQISASLKRGAGRDGQIFVNTTPVSGICRSALYFCQDFPFSVMTQIVANGPKALTGRQHPGPAGTDLLLKVPTAMEIQITHTGLGVSRMMKFVPKLFGMTLEMPESATGGAWQLDPECRFGARGGATPRSYQFAWLLTAENTACRMFSKVERTVIRISNVSLGYEIVAIDPHDMPAGTYHGRLRYTVGDGGDVDFGSGFTYNTNELIFNVNLTVTQEMAVELVSGTASVELLPPGGWRKWVLQAPPYLAAQLSFYLSASGPFKVYLSACEIPMGDGCGIRHVFFNRSVPLQIAVSLPGMRRDDADVNLLVLSTSRDAAPLLAPGPGGGVRRLSYLYFNVNWPESRDMRRYAGKFAGNITVMFDADF